VVIIVVISAAVINIGMNSMTSNKVNSAARRLISDLRFAQEVAITKRIRHGIIFSSNSYTVFENDDTADPARNPQGGGSFIVDFTSGDFSGVTISTTSPQTTLPGLVVKFEPNGKPIDGSNALLTTSSNQVTLNYNGSSKSITITPETGKVN